MPSVIAPKTQRLDVAGGPHAARGDGRREPGEPAGGLRGRRASACGARRRGGQLDAEGAPEGRGASVAGACSQRRQEQPQAELRRLGVRGLAAPAQQLERAGQGHSAHALGDLLYHSMLYNIIVYHSML